jgi:hypothetical protein
MGVKNQGGHLHRDLIFGTGSKPRSRRELITIRQECYRVAAPRAQRRSRSPALCCQKPPCSKRLQKAVSSSRSHVVESARILQAEADVGHCHWRTRSKAPPASRYCELGNAPGSHSGSAVNWITMQNCSLVMRPTHRLFGCLRQLRLWYQRRTAFGPTFLTPQPSGLR